MAESLKRHPHSLVPSQQTELKALVQQPPTVPGIYQPKRMMSLADAGEEDWVERLLTQDMGGAAEYMHREGMI